MNIEVKLYDDELDALAIHGVAEMIGARRTADGRWELRGIFGRFKVERHSYMGQRIVRWEPMAAEQEVADAA